MRDKCDALLLDLNVNKQTVLHKLPKSNIIALNRVVKPGLKHYLEYETSYRSLKMHNTYWRALDFVCKNLTEDKAKEFITRLIEYYKIYGKLSKNLLHEYMKVVFDKTSFSFYRMPEHSKRWGFVNEVLDLLHGMGYLPDEFLIREER